MEYQTTDSVPVIFGCDFKMIVGGDEQGCLEIWDNYEDLKQNSGTIYLGHSSRIVDMAISSDKSLLFSLSLKDEALFEWKIEFQAAHQKPLHSDISNFHSIEHEILSSKQQEFSSSQMKDSMALFKGQTNMQLNKIFSSQKINEKHKIPKIQPQISLKLEHVYGFFCADKRNTLCYNHSCSKPKELDKQQISQFKNFQSFLHNKKKSFKLSLFMKNEEEKSLFQLQPNKHSLYSMDLNTQEQLTEQLSGLLLSEQETNGLCFNKGFECQREIIYITSRVAVLVNRQNIFRQRFYENHRDKISCIHIHPKKHLVATGEVSLKPEIHVWFSKSCQNYRVIKSFHQVGVVSVKFAVNSSLLFSIGIDQQTSIQVTNWELNEVVSFRYFRQEKMIELAVNPSDENVFVTGSLNKIFCWRVQGNSIILENSVDLDQSGFITNLCYVNYQRDGRTVQDILSTTFNGQVIVIREGQYLVCDKLKQNSEINCLKTFCIKKQFFFATASKDNQIMLSDFSLERILKIDLESVKDDFSVEKKQKMDNISEIQSLDIFLCQDETKPIFLVGTKGGYIFELQLSHYLDSDNQPQFKLENVKLLIKNHQALPTNEPNSPISSF